MDYTHLGKEMKVSKLQFGCSRLGKAVKEDTSKIGMQILQQAFDSGINVFDTASNYAYGTSEEMLGEFIKGRRDQVVIVTKGGILISKKASYARFLKPIYKWLRPIVRRSKSLSGHKKRFNFNFNYLTETLDRSLRRMHLDYLDIYLLHSPTSEVLSSRKTNEFLGELKKNKKTKLTGYSLTHIEDAKSISDWNNVDVLQLPINYYVFKKEHYKLVSDIKDKGVKIIGRAPFGRGILTEYNVVKSGRRAGEVNVAIVKKKSDLKKQFGLSEIQLALWFVKDLGLSDFTLFSSFKKDHLAETIDVFQSEVTDDFSWKLLLS